MGDIPLDIKTCENYKFPLFISHKSVCIFKLNRKRYFKTHSEFPLSNCKLILNSLQNRLATFQLLWDTFIYITPVPFSCRSSSFKMDDCYAKIKWNLPMSTDGIDVFFCNLVISYKRFRRFCICILTFPCRYATSGHVLFLRTM